MRCYKGGTRSLFRELGLRWHVLMNQRKTCLSASYEVVKVFLLDILQVRLMEENKGKKNYLYFRHSSLWPASQDV